MSYPSFIQIQPQFELGDFSLAITSEISLVELEKFGFSEAHLNLVQFFNPYIKKESENYSLQFSEGIELSSLEDVLKTLIPWLEDAHFFIYFENARFTFDTLDIIEVKLSDNKLYYITHFIKDLIPNSLLLNLNAGGVQQDFNLPIELLLAQEKKWNKEITNFLSSELNDLVKVNIKQTQEDGGLFYGAAFNLNYEVDCLRKLNTSLPIDTLKSIQDVQSEHQERLIEKLKSKVNLRSDKTVLLDDFQKLEESLGIKFPTTFKRIYTEIKDGRFGPGLGFLPLIESVYSIHNLTSLFREKLNTPDYIVPFIYLQNEVYGCFDTRKSSFPIVNFYRSHEVDESKWYDAYIQQTDSFEEWLDNWIEGLFPEIYEIQNTSSNNLH